MANGYVVGWGTLALINAGLAQGKGRGGLDWFLISLVLGPLATLAIGSRSAQRRIATVREPQFA